MSWSLLLNLGQLLSITAEKAGATREGILRNRLVVRDKVYDAVMFSLIPGPWHRHDLLAVISL